MHTTANGRAYKKYTGPKGERASSLKQELQNVTADHQCERYVTKRPL